MPEYQIQSRPPTRTTWFTINRLRETNSLTDEDDKLNQARARLDLFANHTSDSKGHFFNYEFRLVDIDVPPNTDPIIIKAVVPTKKTKKKAKTKVKP